MKRMNVFFMSDVKCSDLKEYVKMISSVLSDGEIEFISYNFDFAKVNKSRSIISFIKWLKKYAMEFEKEKTVIFRFSADISINNISIGTIRAIKRFMPIINVVDDDNLKNTVKKCRKLSKNKISYLLISNDKNEDIKSVCNKYSSINIPISKFNFDRYDNDIMQWMKKWIYDKNGRDITVFSNLTSGYMMGYMQNDCFHSSCLGRTLYVNEEGIISFCKYHPVESRLINICDLKDLSSIFNNSKFMSVLQRNIERRTVCKKNCDIFINCGGGCPLENMNNEDYCGQKSFKSAFIAMSDDINNILHKGELGNINPCVKNCILMAMASGRLK